MGQACCRPATKDDLPFRQETAQKNGSLPYDTIQSNTTVMTSRPDYFEASSDNSDEFWDAASIGSQFSAASFFSMDDLLDQYQDQLHGNIHDLDEEVAEAAKTGGHLVPVEIEEAAGEKGTPEPPSDSLVLLREVKERLEQAKLAEIFVDTVETLEEEEGAPTTAPALKLDEAATAELRKAQDLNSKNRIIEAHELLVRLCERLGVPLQSLTHSCSEIGLDLLKLETDVHAAHAALACLEEDAGWMISREGALRVLYRHKKNSTQHSLKFHGAFPHSVEHILALIHEWDLIPTWNKFSLEAIKLAEPSVFESYVYGAQWTMRPFKNMQAVIHARGFDLAETHRCLLIFANDIQDLTQLPAGHAPLSTEMHKRKFVNILPGSCIRLRPLPPAPDGTPRTNASLIVHIDPHIPYVPAALVNFALGIIAPYVFNQMKKVMTSAFADEEGIFPERIRAQPELYGLVEQRMAEYADALLAEQES